MADLKVFSAGVAMRLAKQAVEAFEAEHPELDVEFSGGGSVAGVNRLLGGEDLDVLILADQTAIDEQLMPDFADGYFVWGGNEMCITGKGINSDNWKEVLLDPASEVKHTNPYDDPSGYRAVMAMMLADQVEERALTGSSTSATRSARPREVPEGKAPADPEAPAARAADPACHR